MDVLNLTPDSVPTADTTLNIEGYEDHVEEIEQAYPEEDWRTPAEIEAEQQAQAEQQAPTEGMPTEETPTADITIAAGSAIISIVSKDAGNDAAVSTAGTQVSNVILDTTAQKGDVVELMYDLEGEYVGTAFSGINNGIQTS